MRARVTFVAASRDEAFFVTEIEITTTVLPPGDPRMPGDVTVLGIDSEDAAALLRLTADVAEGSS